MSKSDSFFEKVVLVGVFSIIIVLTLTLSVVAYIPIRFYQEMTKIDLCTIKADGVKIGVTPKEK